MQILVVSEAVYFKDQNDVKLLKKNWQRSGIYKKNDRDGTIKEENG